MDPAIALYRNGLTERIVITGRGPEGSAEPEWQIYKNYALAQDVPESVILIEPNATNTRENLLFSAALIDREIGLSRLSTVAVIAKPVHSRRALMTARRVFPAQIRLTVLSPSDPDDVQAASWWQTQRGRQRVFQELKRIGEYALIDHLSEN
jgi:hypothetical protein